MNALHCHKQVTPSQSLVLIYSYQYNLAQRLALLFLITGHNLKMVCYIFTFARLQF